MSYEAAIRALEPRTLERMTGAWLPIRLTAILLLVDMVPLWYLSPLMISLVGLGLVFPALLRTPVVWVAIMVLVTLWIVRLWPLVDNHIYLLAYWALAVAIALGRSDPQRSLAVSARWLVVFVFFWAAMWKGVLSPDYLDGRFFTVRLMSDPRFEAQAVVFSGLSLAEIRQNRAYLEFSSSDAGFEDQGSPGFQSTDRYRFWVTVFTWAVLLGEAGLALAFLLPWGRVTMLVRHGGLIAFCLGTFAFAPVPTFGWLIVTLGLAQVDPRYRLLRTVYVAVWFLIPFVSRIPYLLHKFV